MQWGHGKGQRVDPNFIFLVTKCLKMYGTEQVLTGFIVKDRDRCHSIYTMVHENVLPGSWCDIQTEGDVKVAGSQDIERKTLDSAKLGGQRALDTEIYGFMGWGALGILSNGLGVNQKCKLVILLTCKI